MTRQLTLSLLAASVVLGISDARALPRIADLLLEVGVETAGLIQLAVLGTEPFDPRDAREMAHSALADLGVAQISTETSATLAGAVVARALIDDRIRPRVATHAIYRLVVGSHYRASQPLLAMYGLDDAWDSGWAGSNEQVEEQVRQNASELMASVPEVATAVIGEGDWRVVEALLALDSR